MTFCRMIVQAAAGALPAVTLGSQCQSSASVSPWDTGSHFPNVIICCGGHVDFQWSVRPLCLCGICMRCWDASRLRINFALSRLRRAETAGGKTLLMIYCWAQTAHGSC